MRGGEQARLRQPHQHSTRAHHRPPALKPITTNLLKNCLSRNFSTTFVSLLSCVLKIFGQFVCYRKIQNYKRRRRRYQIGKRGQQCADETVGEQRYEQHWLTAVALGQQPRRDLHQRITPEKRRKDQPLNVLIPFVYLQIKLFLNFGVYRP